MGQVEGVLIGQCIVIVGIMISHAGENRRMGENIFVGLEKYQIIFFSDMLIDITGMEPEIIVDLLDLPGHCQLCRRTAKAFIGT